MKVVTVLAITALLASAVFSVFLMSHEALYVIGGEYNLSGGQSLKGNLYALFANVRVETGAQVQGRIYSFCSDLELANASEENPIQWDLFGFTVHIPRMSQVQISR
jgi:hypothetical protein